MIDNDPLKPENFKEYNNYINQNIFHNLSFDTTLSIDYIAIHYNSTSLDLNHAKNLSSNFNVTYYSKNKTTCSVPLSSNVYTIDIKLIFEENLYTGTGIILRHPSFELIKTIEHFCGTSYSINRVEYSIDIYSNLTAELYRLIKLTSNLSWAGKAFNSSYRTTAYLNDNRKSSSKAGKIYLKKIDDKISIRLEMIWKSRRFKKSNIQTMESACGIEAEKVFKYWKFEVFDYRAFLIDLYKNSAVKNNETELKQEIIAFEKILFERFTSSEDSGGVRVMKKIVKEAKLKPEKYFYKHQFHDNFFKSITGKKFITS